MCGICGICDFESETPVSAQILTDMSEAIVHRGPDDQGLYVGSHVGLGHKRLSIIDLKTGQQPMSNEDETVWITYNGEIYNFQSLRSDLIQKGHLFKTQSDTEVVVHSFEEYGTECVQRFNGMFAFALWDLKTETLFLARDRLGVKPLYYSISGGSLIFASEIKALLRHPAVRAQVEVNAIPEYLFCTALSDGRTMFKDIHSLPPGHALVFKNKQLREIEYWDLKAVPLPAEPSFDQCREHTLALLDESVRMRLMSDVPFGSLLSGGLDSSFVSALATRHVHHRLKTFSMEYSKNNEQNQSTSDTKYANLMAQAFNTDHKEFIFHPDDYHDILQRVIWHVEKPIELTAPSVYLLYKRLKEDITVVLSGEGADELFGGYYFFLKEARTNTLREFPWAPYFKEVSLLLDDEVEKQTRFREAIPCALDDRLRRFESDDYMNRVLYLFVKVYLVEMLERQDKTSMAWSVEARVPFLDYRLVEYIANLPSQYKFRDGVEKYLLKACANGVVPSEIVARKKKPFPFPVDPRSIYDQKNTANSLVQSGNSRIARYFKKKETDDFFHKRNAFAGLDNLAIFRTSYAMIALEQWHQAFGV